MVKETRTAGEIPVSGKTEFKEKMKATIEEAKKDLTEMEVDGFLLVICDNKGNVQCHNVGHQMAMMRIMEGMDSAKKEMMKSLLRVTTDMVEEIINKE